MNQTLFKCIRRILFLVSFAFGLAVLVVVVVVSAHSKCAT
jgi:hypothetical protein